MPARPAGATSYDVRIWALTKYARKSGTKYGVRWSVADKRQHRTFTSRSLADSFRADLLSAARQGVAFQVLTGLPVTAEEPLAGPSWYEHAVAFVDTHWKHWAPRSRQSIADALATATLSLLEPDGSTPPAKELRRALYKWSFNSGARNAAPEPPAEFARAVSWIERKSLPLSALDSAAVIRQVLDSIATTQTGAPAAANTIARRRAALSNALNYAVEQGHFTSNPLKRVTWRAPKVAAAVDRRVVVNPTQGAALLEAIRERRDQWRRLEAFFACIYYAALRPAETVSLTRAELTLPEAGWGTIYLGRSSPAVSGSWTDSGTREIRHLKHRATGDHREVPCPPPLTAILNRHLDQFGTADDGRLFPGERGGLLSDSVYGRVWQAAREHALTPAEQASPLARRPYDLRHAAVSTWLNAGVDATQVAEWAGHSVHVLLKVYAKCIAGRDKIAKQRIESALDSRESSSRA